MIDYTALDWLQGKAMCACCGDDEVTGPHREGCTLHEDAPEAAADVDAARATLRYVLQLERAAITIEAT